ncbi:MAG: hypothetical protein OXI43_02390 [Candidatus Poribacteria bacterium]|nr:hypothetical protein [Candidatus Poribacteria bacterium]
MLRTLFICTFVLLIPIINGCEYTKYIRRNQAYRTGKHPAPAGYEYVKNEKGELIRDKDGNPLFRKIGRPYVSVWMGNGFAPTPEEYERYKQLMEDKYQLEKKGDFAKAEQIAEEIAQLKERAKREIPLVGVNFNHIIYNYGYLQDTTEAENACNALRETFREVYKAHGLEHLLVYSENDFQFDIDKRKQNKILPPPPGYWYRNQPSEEGDGWRLDREGNPVLKKSGEPSINVSIKIGVSPEVQKQINLLKEKEGEMLSVGNDIAAKQIASEIAYLEYKTRSEVIHIMGGTYGGNNARDSMNYFRLIREKTRALIREVSNLHEKEPTLTEK